MNELLSINLYSEKGAKPESINSVHIIKDGGLKGDFRCYSDRKQISITSQEVLDWISEQNEQGLCFRKFSANLVFDTINFEQIQSDSMFSFENASIRIQKTGKQCFGEECSFFNHGKKCILKSGILFACGENSGCIHIGSVCQIIK